jgi:hypothetical protein
MNTDALIRELDMEIARLQQVKALLSGATVKAKRGPKPKGSKHATSFAYGSNKPPRRTMTAEGRARIAAAQKARWAKAKKK